MAVASKAQIRPSRWLPAWLGRLWLPLWGIVSLIVCWELASLVVAHFASHANRILPSVPRVLGTDLPEIATVSKEGAKPSLGGAIHVLWKDSLVTIRRVALGSAAGAAIGVSLGFAVALSGYARRFFQPPVNLLRQVPLLALSMLFLNLFGGSETGIYAFIGFGVGSMLFVNAVAAVNNVPKIQIQYAQTLGASTWRVIRTVILPAVVPELMSGIKVAVGLAWAMALGAEYLGAQTGLGRRILYFELFQYTGRMVVVVGVLIMWALLAHALLTAIGNRLTRWTPSGAQ